VQVSKLEKKINDLAPLEQKMPCRSQMNTLNTEMEQQWEQNQQQISEEDLSTQSISSMNSRDPSRRKNGAISTQGAPRATIKTWGPMETQRTMTKLNTTCTASVITNYQINQGEKA
jgi:hypothetical protein